MYIYIDMYIHLCMHICCQQVITPVFGLWDKLRNGSGAGQTQRRTDTQMQKPDTILQLLICRVSLSYACLCVCVSVCVRVCMSACLHVCVCLALSLCTCVCGCARCACVCACCGVSCERWLFGWAPRVYSRSRSVSTKERASQRRRSWGEKNQVVLFSYGVATISRLLKDIGLFCKRDLQKRPIFCKETYIFKHPTNRSHPIEPLWGIVSLSEWLREDTFRRWR